MIDLQTKSIRLQTRRGTDIENAQYPGISDFEKRQFPDIERKYLVKAFRGEPTGIYNCHGLVFASRRTGIHDSMEVQKILWEDGYEEVHLDNVLPGDIVLYFDPTGDIEHSAPVVSRPGDELLKVPLVVSKWGKFKEAVHYANQCPYNFQTARYFRIRR